MANFFQRLAYSVDYLVDAARYRVSKAVENSITGNEEKTTMIVSEEVISVDDLPEDVRELLLRRKEEVTVISLQKEEIKAVYDAVKQEYQIGNLDNVKDSSIIQGSNTITINNYSFSIYLNLKDKQEVEYFTTTLESFINKLNYLNRELETINEKDNNYKNKFYLEIKEKKEEVTHDFVNTLSQAGIDYKRLQQLLGTKSD
jgi:hypothetical protein